MDATRPNPGTDAGDNPQGPLLLDQEPKRFGSPPRGHALRRSLSLLTVSWLFGSVYFSSTSGAPITLFAQALDATPFQFGLLSAMPFLATLLCSLPSSVLIDKTGYRRPIFFVTHYAHRLMWVPIALIPLWLHTHLGVESHQAGMVLFLLMVFMNYCGQAIGGPGWFGWVADIVPDRLRGRYFTRRRSWGIITAIPAAVITGILLDRLQSGGRMVDSGQTLRWCGYIFIVAAGFGLLDIFMHQFIPDVPARPHGSSLLGIFARPLHNRQFLLFAGFTGTMTFAVSFMGQFATLYLIEKLKINNTQVQLILLVAPSLAQLLVLSAWGKAVDRLGRKPVLIVASLGFVPVGLGWILMNTGAVWLGYVLGAVGAALFAGIEVANFNIVLEFAGTDEKEGTSGTTYFAVNNVINNIAGCLGGLSSGLIAQSLKDWQWQIGIVGIAPIGFYEVLFALSSLVRLLAVVIFLPRLHEPEARPAAEALRFMTVNIYNNLFNALAMPLRAIRKSEGGRRKDEK
jgi:MFS family permease